MLRFRWGQSGVTHIEQAIRHIIFQTWPTMSAWSGNTYWITTRTVGGSSVANRDNAACLCPHFGRTSAVPEDMEVSFVFPGAGQMPLACRVPLASRKVQIQLMGSYSVAYPDMVFRKSVSVFLGTCSWLLSSTWRLYLVLPSWLQWIAFVRSWSMVLYRRLSRRVVIASWRTLLPWKRFLSSVSILVLSSPMIASHWAPTNLVAWLDWKVDVFGRRPS